ncbi:hypothetical protein OH491_08810 [Termitidicoccus mucosus]
MLTPDDVREAGVLRTPSLALALGLILVPLRVLFSSPVSLLHPVSLVTAAPVYWLLLDPIQGAYGMDSVGVKEVRLSYLAIGSFSACVWLAAFGRPWRLPRVVREAATISLGPRTLFGIGVAAFFLAFQRFAIPSGYDFGAMLGAFGKIRWAAPWSRGALGGWDAFLDHIGYFGYIVPPITAFLARRVGWLNWRTLVMMLFSFILLALFSTGGGRRIIGVMAGSGLVVWFLSSERPRLKDLALMGATCAGLLAFLQLMLNYRGVGIAAAFSEETRVESHVKHLHVDDNFLRLAQIIHIIPEQHPYTGMKWLVWVAARPVPRVLWPGKPLDPGFDLPSSQGMQGVSLSVSLVGELYMAFGFLGCIGGGLFLGYLANTLAQVMRAGPAPGALITFGAGLLALFAGMRSGIDLVLMSYGVLAWIALAWGYRQLNPETK